MLGTAGVVFEKAPSFKMRASNVIYLLLFWRERYTTLSSVPSKIRFSPNPNQRKKGRKMANFSDQIDEIKTLLSSDATTKSQKPVAYSTLLHLQEQSSSATGDPSLIQTLADASLALLPPILADIFDEDEEMWVTPLNFVGCLDSYEECYTYLRIFPKILCHYKRSCYSWIKKIIYLRA